MIVKYLTIHLVTLLSLLPLQFCQIPEISSTMVTQIRGEYERPEEDLLEPKFIYREGFCLAGH